MCDNTSAINISKNYVQHSRTKHIEKRYNFLRDHVEKGNIALEFVCTDYQIPNILTKPIACKWFEKLRVALGLIFGN